MRAASGALQTHSNFSCSSAGDKSGSTSSACSPPAKCCHSAGNSPESMFPSSLVSYCPNHSSASAATPSVSALSSKPNSATEMVMLFELARRAARQLSRESITILPSILTRSSGLRKPSPSVSYRSNLAAISASDSWAGCAGASGSATGGIAASGLNRVATMSGSSARKAAKALLDTHLPELRPPLARLASIRPRTAARIGCSQASDSRHT